MKEIAIIFLIVGVVVASCAQRRQTPWTAKDLYSVMVREGVISP